MHRQIYGALRRFILDGQIAAAHAASLHPLARRGSQGRPQHGHRRLRPAARRRFHRGPRRLRHLGRADQAGTASRAPRRSRLERQPAPSLPPRPDHRQRPAAAAQRRRHQLPSRRARDRLLPLLHLVEPSGAQFALARRKPARLPLLRRPSRAARNHRQQHQRVARHRLRARAGHRRHRRAGGARPRLARADGRRRPCLDGGAGLSRRQERLPRQRREARAAEGRPPRLEPLRPGPAVAAPDLRHAVLPVAVRHDHAHRGAAAASRHRRAPRRLDRRGRFRRRIPLSRPSRAGAARPRSRQPRRLHRQLRQDAAAGAAHRLPDRAAASSSRPSTRPCRSPASSRR